MWMVIPVFVVLLFLTVQARTANIPQLIDVSTGEYTLGPDLDPWLFLRSAKSIVQEGFLPRIDHMRYVPVGFDNTLETENLIIEEDNKFKKLTE